MLTGDLSLTPKDNLHLTIHCNHSLHRFTPDQTLTLLLAQLIRRDKCVLVLVVGDRTGSDLSREGLRVGGVVDQVAAVGGGQA